MGSLQPTPSPSEYIRAKSLSAYGQSACDQTDIDGFKGKIARFLRDMRGSGKIARYSMLCVIIMDKFELAEKLYEIGYSHDQVRSIWAYAWNEQHVGISGKKRTPWQREALNRLSVKIEDIEFYDSDRGEFSNYF